MKTSQYDKMTSAPIPRLIISLCIPTVVSMLVTSVYNTADTYFVSKLGTSASGAVGVVFTVMAVIQAVGFTLGMGAGSVIARLLGAKDTESAEKYASSAFFLGIAAGIALALIGLIFLRPLMRLAGSTETILPYAESYARYIIIGAPIMIGAFILNNILRSQGKANLAMLGIASGGVLNVALDPLFIFTFKLGTAGAAIATLISQCVSFFILLGFFILGKSAVRLSLKKISFSAVVYGTIFSTGLPSLSRQGLSSIATMLLNRGAAVYGDSAVAAMSIVGKIFMIIFAVMVGIGQGFQPVVGFNYGAKQYKRVKNAFYFTLVLGLCVMLALGIPTYIFAPKLMSLFTEADASVIEIGTVALRMQCLALPLIPPNTVCNMAFQMTGKTKRATLLACSRQGIFFIPLIIILPALFKLIGVEAAQPLADALSAMLAIPFGISFLRELNK